MVRRKGPSVARQLRPLVAGGSSGGGLGSLWGQGGGWGRCLEFEECTTPGRLNQAPDLYHIL